MSFDREQGKALITSKSFWGVIAAAVGVFLPRYVEQLQGAADDVVVIAGLVFAVIGRFMASAPITGIVKAGK